MIYIFKYKIFRYIFLPNIPPPPFYPIHWITNTKLGIAKLSLRMTIQCWVFQSFPMPFKVRTHACSLTASYCPHPLSNSGETLLRSGLNMQKEASLKTHVSLSHYLNQQRESLETLLIYLSSAPSPPPVPHPPSQLTKLQERQDSNTSKIISIQSQKYPTLVLFCNLWG